MKGRLLPRVLVAALGYAAVGFACGFQGPLFLLPEPGVGPLTGFLMAPTGAGIGIAVAYWAGGGGRAGVGRGAGVGYVLRVVVGAVVFGMGVLGLVLVQ